ncbi:unnamed protein product [Camellia sinensis]
MAYKNLNHQPHCYLLINFIPISSFLVFGPPFSSVPMAKNISRLNHNNYKAFHVLGLFSILLLIQKGGAYQFKVGDSNGWTLPTDYSALNYDKWAQKNRFQVGDTLLFVYPADKDSMFEVNCDDYRNCNTANPIAKHSDGHTVFKFSQSGPFYFISGVKDNCLKKEKLHVIVMADRSNNQTTVASPPPSGSSTKTPAPAPAHQEPPSPPPAPVPMTPSPAPSTYQTPPPSGSVEINPSPAPAADQTPSKKSGASSIVMSFIGSIGAILGSSLLLAF